MTVIAADAVLDALEELHATMLRAGRRYVAGDSSGALDELEDGRRVLDDAIADLRRLADDDPEPEPEPEPRRCSQLTELAGTTWEDAFGGGRDRAA